MLGEAGVVLNKLEDHQWSLSIMGEAGVSSMKLEYDRWSLNIMGDARTWSMKLEDVDEARASWMKLEMVCIQLCQGAVSVGCTDKPYIVDSVPDHMVVVAFQKLAAFIPVVVLKPT